MTINIFISYNEEDYLFKDQLIKILTPLKSRFSLSLWNKSEIKAGQDSHNEIIKQINNANILISLVSSDYLACDSILKYELPKIKERLEANDIKLIPILVRSTDLNEFPLFNTLQFLPKNQKNKVKPIKTWHDSDQAWTHIGKEIRVELDKFINSSLNLLTNKELTNPSINDLNDYQCYCCDRKPQYKQLRNFFRTSHLSNNKLYVFIDAEDLDKPESFVTRFYKDYKISAEKRAITYRDENKNTEKVRLNKVTEDDFEREIEGFLNSRPEKKYTDNDEVWEIALFRINLAEWKFRDLNKLNSYIKSKKINDLFFDEKIIFFFWIDYSYPRSIKDRIFKFLNLKLDTIKKELIKDNNICFLRKFELLDKNPVYDWFKDHEIEFDKNLENKIFTNNSSKIPMRLFEKSILNLKYQ